MAEPRSWKGVRTADGSWTLAHPEHGATCHSLAGAWQQARERYARPCRLRELAQSQPAVDLLDIGTGLGLNLAAALEALSGTNAGLHAVTLERDPDVLRAAIELAEWPGDVEAHYAPVRAALARCLASRASPACADLGTRGSLTLLAGDARVELRSWSAGARFDAVFLDPFAPSVEARCGPQNSWPRWPSACARTPCSRPTRPRSRCASPWPRPGSRSGAVRASGSRARARWRASRRRSRRSKRARCAAWHAARRRMLRPM